MVHGGLLDFSLSATFTPGSTVTVSISDCTGDSMLWFTLALTHPTANLTLTMSDNKGNTYVHLPAAVHGNVKQQIVYVLNPVSGSGHHITFTGQVNQILRLAGKGFRGTAGYEGQALNTLASGSLLAAGELSMPIGPLLVTGLASLGATSSGFDQVGPPPLGGVTGDGHNAFNGSVAWTRGINNSFPASINPTWSWAGTHAPACVAATVFLPVSGVMPNVVGQTLAAATATLTTAGFGLGTVTGSGSVVITQVPAAGLLVPLKTDVTDALWPTDLDMGIAEIVFDEPVIALTWVEMTDSDDKVHVWSDIALPDPGGDDGGEMLGAVRRPMMTPARRHQEQLAQFAGPLTLGDEDDDPESTFTSEAHALTWVELIDSDDQVHVWSDVTLPDPG